MQLTHIKGTSFKQIPMMNTFNVNLLKYDTGVKEDNNPLFEAGPQAIEDFVQAINTPVLRSFSFGDATTSQRPELRQASSEPGRSPRLFPLAEVAEEDRYYSPPPQLFSVPISPNQIGVNNFTSLSVAPDQMASSSGNPYEGMKPTTFAPTYKGIPKNPWNSSVTSYGMFNDQSKFTDNTRGGVHTIMSPIVAVSTQNLQDPVGNLDHAKTVAPPSDSSNQHQSKTFPDLAAEKGIKPWDNTVFDERWLEAAPNIAPQSNSHDEQAAQEVQRLLSRRRRLESLHHELNDTKNKISSERNSFQPDPSIWGFENLFPERAQALREQQSSKDLLPEPPEPRKLDEVMRDLETGGVFLPCGISHHQDVLRRYFYDRVFDGDWDGPILGKEGDSMTKYDGKFISVRNLRFRVLDDIEDCIAFMALPVGEATRLAMLARTIAANAKKEDVSDAGGLAVKAPYVPSYLPATSIRGYKYVLRSMQRPPALPNKTPEVDSNPQTSTESALDKDSATSIEPVPSKESASSIPLRKKRSQRMGTETHQPFMEGLKAIEDRQPFKEQLNVIENRDDSGGSPTSAKMLGRQVKDISSKPKGSSLSSSHLSSFNTTSGYHSSLQGSLSSSHSTTAPPNKDIMEEVNINDILQLPMSSGQQQILREMMQRAQQVKAQKNEGPPLADEVALQHEHLPTGTVSTGMSRPADDHSQMPSSSVMHSGFPPEETSDPWDNMPVWRGPPSKPLATQHAAQPMHYGSPPGPYGYPPPPKSVRPQSPQLARGPIHYDNLPFHPRELGPPPIRGRTYPQHVLATYPQNVLANWNTPPGQISTPTWGDPSMYSGMGVRPPSTNRVANLVYHNDPSFQNTGSPRVHGTPAPFTRPVGGLRTMFGPQGHASSPASGLNPHGLQYPVGLTPTVNPDLPIKPYRTGSDDMRPHATPGEASIAYQSLTRNVIPSYAEMIAAQSSPFAEVAKNTKAPAWGVMKIGNIPYDITKAQIAAFVGKHAKTINPEFGPAIHIIMDRVTGKTNDCYVEFLSTFDARQTSNEIHSRGHAASRIGDRMLQVSVSSQDELLSVAFPKAKRVQWVDGIPIITTPEEEWLSGFKHFVSPEELGFLAKHAEAPHRSNFTLRSPERVYEALITLLAKFPWHSVFNYTVAQRNHIFDTTYRLLQTLIGAIRREATSQPTPSSYATTSYGSPYKSTTGTRDRGISLSDPFGPSLSSRPNSLIFESGSGGSRPNSGTFTGYGYGSKEDTKPALNAQLLNELLSAGLNAPGFSERQRWRLYEMCDYAKHLYTVSPMLQYWPFEVLGRKPRVEEDVIELYAQVMHNNAQVIPTGEPFGSLRFLTQHIDLDAHSLGLVGDLELRILDSLLMGGVENANAEQVKLEEGFDEQFPLLGA